MAAIKPEELIESVRNFPVLYDQTQEQYRNCDYKDIIWKQVAKELNVEGKNIYIINNYTRLYKFEKMHSLENNKLINL